MNIKRTSRKSSRAGLRPKRAEIGWRNWAAVAIIGALGASHGITTAADAVGLNSAAFFPVFRSADGLATEAALAAAAGDFDVARAFADKAVAASPLNQPAARQNAEVELLAGDEAAAERKLGLTALLGWRDLAAQSRLMMRHAKTGDIEATLNSLDAVQRRAGVTDETQQIATLALAEPSVAEEFLQILSTDPPWRQEMFGYTNRLDAQAVDRFAFALEQLKNSRTPPRVEEINSVLDRAVELEEGGLLAAYGPSLLGPTAGKKLTNANSGLFEDIPGDEQVSGGPFAWKRGRAKRTTITTTNPSGSGDTVLFVRTRSRVPADIMVKNLILDQGSYRLSYRQKVSANERGVGLEWTLRCGAERLTVTSSTESSGEGWESVTSSFRIPNSGCPSQILALRSERNLSGVSLEGEFADMSLDTVVD